MPKTHDERVVAATGKRPLTATRIGQKLGYKDHRPVAAALGRAVSQGKLVKTEKGYQKAI